MAEQTDTISRSQLEALKAGIRAAADANPSRHQNKGQRCAEFTRTICNSFGYLRRLADLPAQSFSAAMNVAAQLAQPVRVEGATEASLKAAKESLSPVLDNLSRARNGIAAFRHEVTGALLAPVTDLFQSKGALEVIVQDTVGIMLSEPLLIIESELARAYELARVLATRLPSIGRAVDELKASTTPPADAFPTATAD